MRSLAKILANVNVVKDPEKREKEKDRGRGSSRVYAILITLLRFEGVYGDPGAGC